MEMWKDVTATVMSGEEDVGNNTFKEFTHQCGILEHSSEGFR